jgi:hypothetical protein
MKKLLMSMLIVGAASMASAGLLISVNGELDPADSTVTIAPSESLILDIHNTQSGFEGYWVLYCLESQGSISGGYVAITDPCVASWCTIFDDAVGVGGIPLAEGNNGVWSATYGSASPAIPVPSGVIYDGIAFQCLTEGDTLIVLQEVKIDWTMGEVYDTQIIHQVIPEPATMLILGIGGLFLKRRK